MYKGNDYSTLSESIFPKSLIENHLKLYSGYVKNTNNLMEVLKKGDESEKVVFAEARRRFGWEWNGMRLHEFYFDAISKLEMKPPEGGAFVDAINKEFSSFNDWKREFVGLGKMRGIGWVALYHDPVTGKLINVWINEHDQGHLASCDLILIMDIFEHAWMCGGLTKDEYLDMFMSSVNWDVVENRIKEAS